MPRDEGENNENERSIHAADFLIISTGSKSLGGFIPVCQHFITICGIVILDEC